MSPSSVQRDRWRRYWDRHSRTYDRQMGFMDRVLFRDTRGWVCGQATGEVLEVAIGTGLNLTHYPAGVVLTGIELSPAMLEIAHRRADELGRGIDLRLGDAEALEFLDASFDTVVCTFSLCAIPDHERALAEMIRLLGDAGMCRVKVVEVVAPGAALGVARAVVPRRRIDVVPGAGKTTGHEVCSRSFDRRSSARRSLRSDSRP